LDEIEALNEIAKARRQLCTPVTPVRPRIANATEIQDKLQARRNEKDSRAQRIADIDARLRSHVSDRGKGAAGWRRDLLRQKEQLRKEQAMHSQDFDGEDGKKKRVVKSRAVKAVWSSERKEFQSVLKDRRPKSRLNELKDRALRRKIQKAAKAELPEGEDPTSSWMKTAPRQLVRQYLNKRPDSQARLQEAAERGESPTSPVRHKAAHAKNATPISDPVDSMLLPPFGGRQERVRILESLSAKWGIAR